MADVTLRHVYKVYDGGVRAVNDFDLEIKDKEFVVFVGPSGCGKSTTLRMIAGLEEITAGQLYIDGQLMNEVEPKNRDIAMVFQSYALYPHMTVYDNMAFGLKLRHTPREEIDRRVRAAAEILEISELLTRKPKALSGGQRQRVALGRTIVRDPKVFLLDEPLSNLDAKLRVSMRSEITKLHEKLETTFIYVTHDQTEAMTMGNRIVVMKDGFIQQADTPITLFEDPCNLFVATFLGSPQMNIIDAELFMDGKQLKAKLNGLDNMVVTFPDIKAKQLANKKYIGQKVLLGIRPEHVRPNEGDLKAFIEVVEHLGDESILYCKMENRKDPFIIKIPFNSKIHANEEIKMAFNMDHVYMFDVDTHKAIMGIPHEDEIPVRIVNNLIQVGEQEVVLEKHFVNHLLDAAYDKDIKLAIKPDYVSLTKPSRLNEFEINIARNVIKLGEQELEVDRNHLPSFYDKVFEEKMVMAIKGNEISLEKVDDAYLLKATVKEVTAKDDLMNVNFVLKGLEQPLFARGIVRKDVRPGEEVDIYVPMEAIDVHPEEKLALALKGKFEFVEQKTDYQAVYFSLKGVEGYFAIKVANGEKVELGKEVDLYLPYNRIKLYDQDHNKINSREVVYSNDGIATVKTVNGMMKINIGGATLTYPNNKNYADGQYEITFKQDKLVPIFSKKMLKNNDKLANPEMEAPNKIKVSAYDEDVLGDKLLIYVQIPGCGLYASLVVPNNFSVYKMPKFEMYVPSDAFELKAIK